MTQKVAIIGCGMSQFGNQADKNLMELLKEASTKAMEHAGLGRTNVSALYVSTMLAGELTNQTAVASALSD